VPDAAAPHPSSSPGGHPAYETLRPVTAAAGVVLADNPSGMTLEGTNTWVLRAPGHESAVVVDPGPDDAHHLDRLAEQGPVELILLTHHHLDHTEAASAFAERTGAPVRALDPELCAGAAALAADEVVRAGGLGIRVLATPGHTRDSVCLVVEGAEGDAWVLTGDTILGRGTTVLGDHPGALGEYLGSLEVLAGLPAGTRLLPGHGPDLPDAPQTAREYLAHRRERLEQVRAALERVGQDATPRQVVEVVYADVDESLWPAADVSVAAQLEYLRYM
jgi:glyoxylase-like metal-dependent hydrolase (beta-lactamase superfamily II)